jgi:hypothetical protein
MRPDTRERRRGGMLIVSCIFVMVFILVGGALYVFTTGEARAAERDRDEIRALALADAGLERAMNDLRLDLQNDPVHGSWSDGVINGITCRATTDAYNVLPYTGNALGSGTYAVELKLAAGRTDEIWVRVMGNESSRRAQIQAYVRARDMSPWHNAIYAGTGGGGTLINGHVKIAGSVHILGDNLGENDLAMDMSGSSAIINNYGGMADELVKATRALTKVMENGKLVESLEAELRVRRGKIALSGSGTVGEYDNTGNSLKELIDGVYMNDGFTGDAGEANVFSDNGAGALYDCGNAATFPKLTDPYNGYATYLAYLKANSYVVPNGAKLNSLKHILPGASFSYVDPQGKGSIVMANGHMTVNGIVYVDGDFGMGNPGASDTITYSGRGTLVVTGQAKMNANFYPATANSYPATNIVAVMTPNTIEFNGAQTKVAGLFYGETSIVASKQTTVAGSFVSTYFDMGSQVPSIYQVPINRNEFPPGLIGTTPNYSIGVLFWEKLPVAQYPTQTTGTSGYQNVAQ